MVFNFQANSIYLTLPSKLLSLPLEIREMIIFYAIIAEFPPIRVRPKGTISPLPSPVLLQPPQEFRAQRHKAMAQTRARRKRRRSEHRAGRPSALSALMSTCKQLRVDTTFPLRQYSKIAEEEGKELEREYRELTEFDAFVYGLITDENINVNREERLKAQRFLLVSSRWSS